MSDDKRIAELIAERDEAIRARDQALENLCHAQVAANDRIVSHRHKLSLVEDERDAAIRRAEEMEAALRDQQDECLAEARERMAAHRKAAELMGLLRGTAIQHRAGGHRVCALCHAEWYGDDPEHHGTRCPLNAARAEGER